MKTKLPLRTPEERMDFFDHYFAAVDAETMYQSDYYREYRLPRDVDKELTDRPFYWLWVEKTDQEVTPTTLRLAFHSDVVPRENERLKADALREAEQKNLTDIERMYFRPPTAELITLGSFRLEKLYSSVDQRGAFACVAPAKRLPHARFAPWLMINALVSYRCDSVEQEIMSIAVCLSNGQIVDGFYDMVKRIEMTPCSATDMLELGTMSMKQGLDEVKKHILNLLLRRPAEWAHHATTRLNQELRQIQTYYQSILPDLPEEEQPIALAEQSRKEQELTQRTQPRIEIEFKQIALVALIDHTSMNKT